MVTCQRIYLLYVPKTNVLHLDLAQDNLMLEAVFLCMCLRPAVLVNGQCTHDIQG